MAPADIIRQEDKGRGVSPATGDGTEQGPNEDQNDVPPSPGTETQPPNEDDVVAEASPGTEEQGANEDDELDGEPVEVPPDGTEGEITGDGSGEALPEIDDEFLTPTTHADADEQAARLGITFPEETTKVVEKAEFIAKYRQEQAAAAAGTDEPPADEPA
jgi:hypothetical protein